MFGFIPPISPQFPATRHACGRTEPAQKKGVCPGRAGTSRTAESNRLTQIRTRAHAQACAQAHQDLSPSSHNLWLQ